MAAQKKLGLGLQLSYGLGSAAFGIGGVSLGSAILLLYFNQVIGLPAVWVGAAIMTTIVVDAFTDPLIGMFSDRLRAPLGRRHTLMYAAALPAALGFFTMWHAPSGLSAPMMLGFVVAVLIFVNISISLYEIPSLALAPELAPDYAERSQLIAFRWFFLILASATTNFVLYQVFLREDEANPLGVLNRERYEAFGLVSAGVIFAAILISTTATRGRVKHLHVPAAQKLSLRAEWMQIRAAFTHRALTTIMLGGLMMGFGAGTTAGLITYFYLHFWGLKPQEIGYFVIGYFIASFVSVWAGPRIGARFGKKQAIIGLYVLWLFTAVGPLSLRLAGLMPPNGAPSLLPILIANATCGLICALCCHINLGSAIADAIDDIAVKTGRRAEGTMFAVYSVFDKIANGGGAFVAGAVISAVAFPTGAIPGTVDPAIVTRMVLINLAIVTIFNVASILFLSRYNLTRADHERNAAILEARKRQENGAMGAPAGAAGELSR